jgi:hypothetical protein
VSNGMRLHAVDSDARILPGFRLAVDRKQSRAGRAQGYTAANGLIAGSARLIPVDQRINCSRIRGRACRHYFWADAGSPNNRSKLQLNTKV